MTSRSIYLTAHLTIDDAVVRNRAERRAEAEHNGWLRLFPKNPKSYADCLADMLALEQGHAEEARQYATGNTVGTYEYVPGDLFPRKTAA